MARIKAHLRAVPPVEEQTHNAIATSTLVVIAATLGSVLLGFVREIVNARYYGTQWQMDTFLAAATIPTILFGVFNGALVSALIPTFTHYLTRGEEDEAWRVASTIINTLFLVLTAGAVLGYIYAPYYVPLIAHGFPGPQMGVAVHMTRWLMPTIVVVSLSGVVSAMLNAYHRFRATSVVGIALNIVTIVCVMLLNHRLGIFALVLGTTLGIIAQLAVQLPSFLSVRKYRFCMDLKHPGLQTMWVMLGPIVVGSAAGQIAIFFDRYFASTLTPGYMAGMNYVIKLVSFPQQIFAAAIATVIFPLLAAQFANANRAGVKQSTIMGLRVVNFITIPAVCILIVLAKPIVQTLFERGIFAATATALCSGLMPFAAVGLIALAANVVLTRCCFACKETRWTVAISVFSVLLNVLLSLVWLPTLGARGLLLANSISQSLQAVMLFVLVWNLLGGLSWKPLVHSALKICASAVAMIATLHWIHALGAVPDLSLVARSWYLFGQLSISGLVFIAVARLLNVEELTIAAQLIMQKFVRNVEIPPENSEAPIA